jgi:hypothetical protein
MKAKFNLKINPKINYKKPCLSPNGDLMDVRDRLLLKMSDGDECLVFGVLNNGSCLGVKKASAGP